MTKQRRKKQPPTQEQMRDVAMKTLVRIEEALAIADAVETYLRRQATKKRIV